MYSRPQAKGTFTLEQVKKIFEELVRIGTIEWVYFEGGEPFLFYPIMVEATRIAHERGFKTGIVTNAYWATSETDAELWLKPLVDGGITDISISDDALHYEKGTENLAKHALSAAKKLRVPVSSICIEKPIFETLVDKKQDKGRPQTTGGAMFRGRAVEKLVKGLPLRTWEEFTECPYENLRDPGRVHLDAYGHVHICQGLSMGNMWEIPLSKLVIDYRADVHPICGPLGRGGPAALAREYGVMHDPGYVDACHFCYCLRLALIERFPHYLAPKQVYGLDSDLST